MNMILLQVSRGSSGVLRHVCFCSVACVQEYEITKGSCWRGRDWLTSHMSRRALFMIHVSHPWGSLEITGKHFAWNWRSHMNMQE